MRTHDAIHRFVIENSDVRGLLVHLDQTWHAARGRVDYPRVIEQVLGEAFAATVLMSATIKFAGKLTLQVRGPGPVHLLVVQVTEDGATRGLARWERVPENGSLNSLFGSNARMTISVEADALGQMLWKIIFKLPSNCKPPFIWLSTRQPQQDYCCNVYRLRRLQNPQRVNLRYRVLITPSPQIPILTVGHAVLSLPKLLPQKSWWILMLKRYCIGFFIRKLCDCLMPKLFLSSVPVRGNEPVVLFKAWVPRRRKIS